jgi:hypothetical protein
MDDRVLSAALTRIHERLFHSIGTYVKRSATTASSTRVHREAQAGEAAAESLILLCDDAMTSATRCVT